MVQDDTTKATDVDGLYSRAFARLERGEYRAAARDLAQVVSHTQSWEALLVLAFTQQQLGELRTASDTVEVAIDRAHAYAKQVAPVEAE